jgi:hypothetical protein
LFRLFGNTKERESKQRSGKIGPRVEKELAPTNKLCRAIVQASGNCRDAVKVQINAPTEVKRLELEASVFFEFLCFYVHLTMRSAFGQLTEEQTQNLRNYLSPLVSSAAIDSCFARRPDELKGKMHGDFCNKLNDAEKEYTEVTRFDSSEPGGERSIQKLQGLFMKLGANVSTLFRRDAHDLTMMVFVSDVAINEWIKMDLDKLVAEVKKCPPPKFDPESLKYP